MKLLSLETFAHMKLSDIVRSIQMKTMKKCVFTIAFDPKTLFRKFFGA